MFKKVSDLYKRINEIPIKSNIPPNMTRAYLGLDPIIPIDKDKQIVKILDGKNIFIRFDSILPKETIRQIQEDIQNQIEENGFIVMDARCKIFEIDRPISIIDTK